LRRVLSVLRIIDHAERDVVDPSLMIAGLTPRGAARSPEASAQHEASDLQGQWGAFVGERVSRIHSHLRARNIALRIS